MIKMGEIIIFFKTINIKKENKKKIDVIFNGKNLEEVVKNAVKYTDVTYVIAPNKEQKKFLSEYNTHISDKGKIKKSVYELEEESVRIGNYITIHKNEYKELLKAQEELEKFKRNGQKVISEGIAEQIKSEYILEDETGQRIYSQRDLAKKYKVSLYVINRIINNKYC